MLMARKMEGGKNMRQKVEERVEILLSKACEVVKARPSDALKYVKTARKLCMRHRIPVGRARKRMFCKKCLMPFAPGYNMKVRQDSKNKRVLYVCECGGIRSFSYMKKKGYPVHEKPAD